MRESGGTGNRKKNTRYNEEVAGSGNWLDVVGGNALFTKSRKNATFSWTTGEIAIFSSVEIHLF